MSRSIVRGQLATLTAASLVAFASQSASAIIINGGFETGDTSGWTEFPTPNSTFNVITSDVNSGVYSGRIFNDDSASAAVVKNANVGVGVITPNTPVNITFAARGSAGEGGVQFAEFFSELSGGGTSASEILGGGPLFLDENWQNFSFNTVTGSDVSGGVTLQFTATTGGAPGSFAETVIDDVVITIVPEPATLGLATLGATALFGRRRG